MDVRASKHINAPIDIVFDVFSDIEKIQDRIDDITQVEILSDIKHGVGTRWRETRVMFGKEATEEMEISKIENNRSYDVVASSHGMDYHSVYTFTEKDGGTLVEMTFSGQPITLMAKLMTPVGYLFKNATKKALEGDMDNLKVICEQQASEVVT
jgi:uncharacterized membrane protein